MEGRWIFLPVRPQGRQTTKSRVLGTLDNLGERVYISAGSVKI